MTRRSSALAYVVLLCSASIACDNHTVHESRATQEHSPSTALPTESLDIDYGRLAEATTTRHQELDLNPLNKPNTKIIAFRKSCTCSSAILITGDAPNERYDLSRVHFPLKLEHGSVPKLSLGLALTGNEGGKTIRGDVSLTYKQGDGPLSILRVNFKAQIVKEFDIAPSTAVLGDLGVDKGIDQAVKFGIRSSDGKPFNVLSVKSCPQPFLAVFECTSMRRDEWVVSVATTEKLEPGPFNAVIRLATDRPVDAVCRITGKTRALLEYSPKALLFMGRVPKQETIEKTIEIVDAHGATPSIESWKFTSDDGVAHGVWLDTISTTEGKCSLRFQFQSRHESSERGRLNGQLRLRVIGSRTEEKSFLVVGSLDA